jgi:hypothetical protein
MVIAKKKLVKPKLKRVARAGAHEGAATPPPTTQPTTETTASGVKSQTERNEYGYRVDSDVAIVLEEMMTGGEDKHAIAERLAKRFEGQTTKSGRPKPVSTVMNQVQSQMVQRGFTVESTWRLVPPENGVLQEAPKRTRTAAVKSVKPKLRSSKPSSLGKLPVKTATRPIRKPKPKAKR